MIKITQKRSYLPASIISAGAVMAALVIWLPAPAALKLVAAMFAAGVAPGWALLHLLRLPGLNRLEQVVAAVGLSYALTVLAALLLVYAAGSLSMAALMIILPALTVALAAAAGLSHRPSAGHPALKLPHLLYAAGPVAAAAFFSLTNLAYADYWGDEMNGLLRALAIISQQPETLFEHTKGPVEVLVPAVFGLLSGGFSPLTVRLPFAVAHITGLAAFYLLARRMFGQNTALLAGLLLAINGLYIAFSRMVQYQAIVFMMTALSLLLAHHFYRRGSGRSLILSALLSAVGLLAHYDMLLALPAIAYLAWLRLGWRKTCWQKYWPALAAAGLLFAGMAGLFYVPFLLHPSLNKTSSYLNRIIGPANWPSNSFDELYIFSIMYNSRYYAALIAAAGLALMIAHLGGLLKANRANPRLWLVGGAGAGLMAAAWALNWGRAAPLLATITVLTALVAFRPVPERLKLVYIWLGLSFVGYVFFVDHPRTHLQIIFPGWSILAAAAFTGGWAALTRRRPWPAAMKMATVAAAVLLPGFFGYYEYLLFADASREYVLTYPAHKNVYYWEHADFPFGSRRLYGAPHRLGWQMITQQTANGTLTGDWYSNDDGSNLFWYTLGNPNTPCYPRYYYRTAFEQKPAQFLPAYLQTDPTAAGYVPRAEIWHGARRQIEIFEFSPLESPGAPIRWDEPARYTVQLRPEDFWASPYRPAPASAPEVALNPVAVFAPNPTALEQIAAQYNDPRITQVKDRAVLTGYDLDTTWAAPGGALLVTLHWQAGAVINLPYKTFVHLQTQTGQTVAQSDQIPACGARPTNTWPEKEIVPDRHFLSLPAEMPPGQYTLAVGLYEPQTGLRMDILDELGHPQGVSYPLNLNLPTVKP